MKVPSPVINSPVKLVYLVLGVLFLMLGLIGLVIPVIPGILFLFAAVYVLAKVSRRVRRWSQSNATYRSMSTHFDRMNDISIVDRIKVTGLVIVGTTARGVDKAIAGASNLCRRVLR